jgi:peptidyl-prolyl cis-trans isomerase SurA
VRRLASWRLPLDTVYNQLHLSSCEVAESPDESFSGFADVVHCLSAQVSMNKHLLLLAVAAVLLVPVFVSADTVVEEIVARVNNSIITRTQYQREEKQLRDEAEQQDPTHADQIVAQQDKDVLRGLIDRQLLLEKGKELGITAETEVIKRLDEIRKQMKLDSMDDLEKAARAQGLSFEDFKQGLKTQIITQKVIQQEVSPHINVSNQEVRRFYDQHRAEMAQPELVRLSEIMISTEEAGQDEQKVAAAKAKAEDILKQIRGGASFEDLAKKESQDPSSTRGGDLGPFERGKLAKQLEDLVFGMKKDDVSDVIQTRQGFVILKVTDHVAAGIPSFAEAEDHVRDELYMRKMQPAMRDYLKKLREEAYIDIKAGYVDTGASGAQTKPVVTTAAKESNAKELKKRKKIGIF